LLFT
jgi:chromosome segregation ATPase